MSTNPIKKSMISWEHFADKAPIISQEEKLAAARILLTQYFSGFSCLQITEEMTVEQYLRIFILTEKAGKLTPDLQEVFLNRAKEKFLEKSGVHQELLQEKLLSLIRSCLSEDIIREYDFMLDFLAQKGEVFDVAMLQGYNIFQLMRNFIRVHVYTALMTQESEKKPSTEMDEVDFMLNLTVVNPEIHLWEEMNRYYSMLDSQMEITISSENEKLFREIITQELKKRRPTPNKPYRKFFERSLENYRNISTKMPGLLSLPLGCVIKVMNLKVKDQEGQSSLELFKRYMIANKQRALVCISQEALFFIQTIFKDVSDQTLQYIQKNDMSSHGRKICQILLEAQKITSSITLLDSFCELISATEDISKVIVDWSAISSHILNKSIAIKREYEAFQKVLKLYKKDEKNLKKFCAFLVEVLDELRCSKMSSQTILVASYASYLARVLETLASFEALYLGYEKRLKDDGEIKNFIDSMTSYKSLVLADVMPKSSEISIKVISESGDDFLNISHASKDDEAQVREDSALALEEEDVDASLERLEKKIEEDCCSFSSIVSDIKAGVLRFAINKKARYMPEQLSEKQDVDFHYNQAFFHFEKLLSLVCLGQTQGVFFTFQNLLMNMAVSLEINSKQFKDQTFYSDELHNLEDKYPQFEQPVLKASIQKFNLALLLARYPETIRNVIKYNKKFSQDLLTLFTKFERWEELAIKERLLCIREVASDFCSYLQIMHLGTSNVEKIQSVILKIVELGETSRVSLSATSISGKDIFDPFQKVRQRLIQLSQSYEGFLGKKEGMPLTTIKNILVQLNLIRDCIFSTQENSVEDRLTRVKLIPCIDRAVELSLELFSTFFSEKIISHHLSVYEEKLGSHLNMALKQALEHFKQINFGNQSHYLHANFPQTNKILGRTLSLYRDLLSKAENYSDLEDFQVVGSKKVMSALDFIEQVTKESFEKLAPFILEIVDMIEQTHIRPCRELSLEERFSLLKV